MPNLTITLPKSQIQLLDGNQICLEPEEKETLLFTHEGKEFCSKSKIYPEEKTFNYSSLKINNNVGWGNKDCPKSNLTLSERISLYLNSFFQKTVKIRWEYPGKHDYTDESLTITVDNDTFNKMKKIQSQAIPCVDGFQVEGGNIIAPTLF